MSDGSEFQVCGAATENARRANSVRVLAVQTAAGRRKIAEAEQEQLAGSGRSAVESVPKPGRESMAGKICERGRPRS